MGLRKHCGKCGGLGHNARTCGLPPRPKPKRKAGGKRNEEGRYLPGNNGNPGGRTKEHNAARRALRDYIQGKIEVGGANTVIDRLIEIALTAEAKESVNASRVILEFGYGKPPTIAEIGAQDDSESGGQLLIIGGAEIRF